MTQVLGDSGPPVLLLPGGAESAEGFFPGLVEGLLEDPGCRVVLHDRPGTGHSGRENSLVDASKDLHETVTALGLGPVVAVGQSLGGAVAALLAADHPEDVAGLVLLDPTPVNDPDLAGQVARRMRTTQRIADLPGGGRVLGALLRATTRRMVAKHGMDEETAAAAMAIADLDSAQLSRAVLGLEDVAATFDAARLRGTPAAVVTADRKPTDAIRLAHQRLADALGVPLTSWPGAEHAVHLTHPVEVLEVCRAVVRQAWSPGSGASGGAAPGTTSG